MEITIDDLGKVEVTVGKILAAEPIEGSDKLLKLRVDFGPSSAEASEGKRDERQVLSGIAKYFPDPNVLVGKHCPFVTNLPPRMMMGLESQAMIFAAGEGETFGLFETKAPPGATAH